MIKSIRIDNFKSLVDFELSLDKLTCLVGLNGAGKSTVLQAIDFLSQLMRGDIDLWLKQRQWKAADLNSKLSLKSNITFEVTFECENHEIVFWQGSVNRRTLRCTTEGIEAFGHTLLNVEDGKCSVMTDKPAASQFWHIGERDVKSFSILFKYQGSILSQLKETELHPALQELKKAVADISSLDSLSPELLRSKSKASEGQMGLGGNRLSAFLHESGEQTQKKLFELLHRVYPHLQNIETRSLRSGWKELEISEVYDCVVLKTQARHINDGMLRLLAILAQLERGNQFLLFDEIENGINTELVEFLIGRLVYSRHQVLITTHSPLILNFLDDDVAKKGVIYLYKNSKGYTQATHLFEIPSLAKKLEFMGPGEAFIDTDLTQLDVEILDAL